MRTWSTLVITAFSMLTTPVAAAGLMCPQVVALPSTVSFYDGRMSRRDLVQMQSALTNLRTISNAYMQTRSRAMRSQIANCMIDHMVVLADGRALTRPLDEAGYATLALMQDEVETAVNIAYSALVRKPEFPLIQAWLSVRPRMFVATR